MVVERIIMVTISTEPMMVGWPLVHQDTHNKLEMVQNIDLMSWPFRVLFRQTSRNSTINTMSPRFKRVISVRILSKLVFLQMKTYRMVI